VSIKKKLGQCVIILLALAAAAFANTFTDNAADHLWNTAGNWSGGVPVMGESNQWGDMTVDGTICIIDDTHVGASAASAGGVYPGCYGGENEMYMTGGELTVNYLNIGRGSPDSGGNGYFKMTGGVINAQGFKIPNQFSGTAGNIVGHVDLHGGTIYVTGWFHMGSRISGATDGGIGTMDVTGGILITSGDLEDKIQGYIDDGWITAFSGNGYFKLDYGIRNIGKTTLTAATEAQASDPNPPINATDIEPDVILTWTAGLGATSHDVHFGTTNPPPFVQNQPAGDTDYDPCNLNPSTTYYWQINEQNASGGCEGAVWKFTTGPLPSPARDLKPADGAANVNPNTPLRWIVGADANSHDVYFGTNPSPGAGEFQGLCSEPVFDPTPMDPNTTYYWRIDEKNEWGVTPGPVWTFTTAPVLFGDLNGDWFLDILDLRQFALHWLETGCTPPDSCGGSDLDASTQVDLQDYALLTPDMHAPGPQPPYTDYCQMISQEIQGKKHGFMAGNLAYYVGGRQGWSSKYEDETIGLTHPFHHDLRCRGTGMVQHPATGYGHDLTGWEFYKETKIAYGTVIIDSNEYTNPVPTTMYWRPDKMICQYNVAGVNIHEEKFIADNDVACSIITSDAPITIKFKGQSFACTRSVT